MPDKYLHAPGHASRKPRRDKRPDPAIGDRFGEWTVVGPVVARRVPVQCSCGVRSTARVDNLQNGSTTRCRSCGGWARRGKLSAGGRAAFMGKGSRVQGPRAKPYPGAISPEDDRWDLHH